MKYTIQLNYTTGDSFSTYDTSGDIEVTWENLDVAKAALQRIANHERAYRSADKYSSNAKDRESFSKVPGYTSEYAILLPMDDGSEQKVFTFWQGYFEHLNSAEIVTTRDHGSDDMRVYF